MPKSKKIQITDDDFLMDPKVDFAFKLLFGNEKHPNIFVTGRDRRSAVLTIKKMIKK